MTAFPGETVSFDVEREISIFALDNAMEGDRRLFLVTQRKIGVSEPEEQDLYEIGTVCHVLQIIKTSETTVRVLVEGEQRARLHKFINCKRCYNNTWGNGIDSCFSLSPFNRFSHYTFFITSFC